MRAKILVLVYAILLSSVSSFTFNQKITSNENPKLNYRLPNDTIPLDYEISLSTDIHAGIFDFYGNVTIRLQAVNDTQSITLHYRETTVLNVDLKTSTGSLIQSDVPIITREDVEFLIIKPAKPLTAGEIYQIQITYKSKLRDYNKGFFRTSYVNSSGKRIWLATTQFETTDARHAFPW